MSWQNKIVKRNQFNVPSSLLIKENKGRLRNCSNMENYYSDESTSPERLKREMLEVKVDTSSCLKSRNLGRSSCYNCETVCNYCNEDDDRDLINHSDFCGCGTAPAIATERSSFNFESVAADEGENSLGTEMSGHFDGSYSSFCSNSPTIADSGSPRSVSSSPLRNGVTLTSSWVLVAMLMMILSSASGLRINPYGGYEDVVISVGNEVPPITCPQLKQNLENIFAGASEYLNEGTKGRAYFHRVTLVVPASWDHNCGILRNSTFTSASSTRDAHFRVGGEHPVFGHNPWTQQSKGCGKQGDFISLGYQYVMRYNETENGQTVPADMFSYSRAFVHEWAKFRYGVFEEIGFANDPIYPVAYYHGNNPDQAKPTSCTNRPLQGNWSGGCKNKTGSGGGDCVFVPSWKANEEIRSSIMSHPELAQVTSFCNSSTHNRQAPTKQNVLCDHQSVSQVIYAHPDFHNVSTLSRNGRGVTPQFVVKQLTEPRFVLMVEETGNMNLRDVWKYLKLAIRKFIKYDLPQKTHIGLMTVSSDIRILANMTILDDNLRGILAEKLPNYPSLENKSGTLALRKGISQAINMLKWNGQRVGGSVIILISQASIYSPDLEACVHLLRQEDVSIATIEYPSMGDGKISFLSQATSSPHFSIRETGVGTVSHLSTYIQLVNSMMEIQRFFTKGIAQKWPTLVHQQEFKGDAPSFVESKFNFDPAQTPAEFWVYIPSPIDPKVNYVELTSPSGIKYTDQLSVLHDINVIKIGAVIDQPGVWSYRIERLGDSHQSHFVQVVTTTADRRDEFNARVYSSAEEDESRGVNLSQQPLILYTEVKRGISPVLDADVEAFIVAGTTKWTIKLFDSGNGDPDLTAGDGIYSRYIVPPVPMQSAVLEITIVVRSSPYKTKYLSLDSSTISSSGYSRKKPQTRCCGSKLITDLNTAPLKTMGFNERVASYSVKISHARSSDIYPPGRIGDLHMVSSYDTQVILSFTAPGDDYDIDNKTVQLYQVYYRRSFDSKPILKEQLPSQDSLAGSEVNITLSLPSYGIFYLTVVAVDPHGVSGRPSNPVQVKVEPPPPDSNSVSPESQVNIAAKSNSDGKLSSKEIALIIVGVIALLLLIIFLIVLCIWCRRRTSKGMGSTETKISTISDSSKAPIHWSASQLLSEHEKRQSVYAPSSHSTSQHGSYPPSHPGHYPGQHGSPGSSPRSFRSISDNARKTSMDYESCSSDPTVRSAKGPTDYETPIESDQENYRTIDSFSGVPPPYRLVNGVPHHAPQYNPVRGGMSHYSHQQPNIPVNSTNSSSHMQYNPNIQGSLTSVNSKARRNITMV